MADEIFRDVGGTGIGLLVADDVGGDGGMERAVKALAGIKNGASKAIGSALRRAMSSGSMLAQKEIQKQYTMSAGTYKSYTRTRSHVTSGADGTTAEITFAGEHIPLYKYDVKIGSDGRVSARVKRSSARTALEHAFAQKVGGAGHMGIFQREGTARLPIHELFGPSVPQILGYEGNDDLTKEIGDKIREKFEERIDHEILALLNGWRA